MRDGQTSSLLFLCFIFIKACLAGDDVLVLESARARLGQSASLSCRVGGDVHVVLSEWTRCTNSSSISVFNPRPRGEHGAHVNQSYTGLVSITEYHTLTFRQVQDGDFGEYCCKVTTFPSGSLVGQVHLLRDQDRNEGQVEEPEEPERSPAAVPAITLVYISCGVVALVLFTGIITLLLCKTRRRKVRNLVHVTVAASISPKQPSLLQKDSHTSRPDEEEEEEEEEEQEDDMYLNVMG